jgi:hypothetical protein
MLLRYRPLNLLEKSLHRQPANDNLNIPPGIILLLGSLRRNSDPAKQTEKDNRLELFHRGR